MTSRVLLSIGEVASATGATIPAIRHYDALGLIQVGARVGGKRRFEAETVGRVNFVRRAQEAGFSLNEVRQILDDSSGVWHTLVEAKIAELVERRSRLADMMDMLAEIRDCGCRVVAECSQLIATSPK